MTRRPRGGVGRAAVMLLSLVMTQSAHAYSHFSVSTGGRLKWADARVRWFATDGGAAGVSRAQFQGALASAFATWEAVPTATIGFDFAGFTSAQPFEDDGLSVLGFQNEPDMERVLGATTFVTDVVTGELIESDIFFNSAFAWSVAPEGAANLFDLESIALHEIGHLHGLAHSAMGETELRAGGRRVIAAEAVMFPIAFATGNIAGRTLKTDDIAGIGDIYPAPTFSRETGSISGKVTKSGKGVLGAHVVAFDMQSKTLVGGFSLTEDGSFVIAGLDPGPHIIRVEPLDDGDIESFFDLTLNVDINFRPQFYERIVVVPRGGGTSGVELKVVPK